jgi:hypothetical protein
MTCKLQIGVPKIMAVTKQIEYMLLLQQINKNELEEF